TSDRIATPLSVVPADPLAEAIARILHIAEQYHAVGIVVGLPRNMDGTEGPQAEAARAAGSELAKRTKLDVRLWDERLSSFEADKALAGKLTRNKRRRRQDAVAAAVILQDFLSHDGPESAARIERTENTD
ncbi:MAG: Holliday junction resolvase RuvX, partial [Planctomycetota bacterium]